MASRVESLVGARTLAKPLISTFHSFCVRLLRRDIDALQIGGKGYRKDFVIYDEADQQNVVKAAMRRLGIDDKQLTPRNVLSTNLVGQEPHARPAGGLPAVGRSQDRARGPHLRGLPAGTGEVECARLRRPAALRACGC